MVKISRIIEKRTRGNILVLAWGGIGDMIWLTPSLIALRRKFQSSKITVVSQEVTPLDVIKDSNIIDETFSLSDSIFRGAFGKIRLIKKLRKIHPDITISNSTSPCFISSFLSFLSGAKIRIGGNRGGRGFLNNLIVPSYESIHEVEANLKIFSILGISNAEKNLFMKIPEGDVDFAAKWLDSHAIGANELLIGIHPGPGRKYGKRWNIEKFIELCNLIQKEGIKIVVFGGPDESDLVDYICSSVKGKIYSYIGNSGLNKTAALLKKCSIFVSSDSGLAHVASAVGVSVISIFGPTVYWRTMPYGKGHVVIRKVLPCSPCYKVGKPIKCNTLKCWEQISAEDVFREIIGMRRRIESNVRIGDGPKVIMV